MTKKMIFSIRVLFDPTYVQTNKTTDTTATTGNDLSVEMKTFYSQYLIKLVGPKLIHDQFGQQEDIPQNNGKTIEFRKFEPLPKLLTPLSEGVTPAGQKLDVTAITATVNQFGGFIEISDILDMTAYEKIMTEATELLADQAGRTLDSVTRDIITAGTNVLYANSKTSRGNLVQTTDKLTVTDIRKAVRKLKIQNAPKFGAYYAGIIHPDNEYDLMDDNDWKYPHQYVDTDNIYDGELGAIAGVRFVETTEAKVWHAEDLISSSRTLTVTAYSSNFITVSQTLTSADQAAIVGRKMNINGAVYTATTAGAHTVGLVETPTTNPVATDVVYPGEAGKAGANVYATMIIGDKAYGTTKVTGGGLQHITKSFGSSGTSDPLNQRATAGWKAIKTAVRLVEQYMVRIESTSSFATTESN